MISNLFSNTVRESRIDGLIADMLDKTGPYLPYEAGSVLEDRLPYRGVNSSGLPC